MAKIAQEITQREISDALKRPSKALPSSSATVDTTSTKIINYNKKRRGLVLTNTGANPVFIGIGEAAVANQGLYILGSGGIWEMDNFTFTNRQLFGIAIGGATNIAIQEFE